MKRHLTTETVVGQRLARILSSYRLTNSDYYCPPLAPSNDRLMTENEWAREIEDRLFIGRRFSC